MPLSPVESALCSSLISVLQIQKQMGIALVSAIKELAALRETVKTLDPTFSDVHSQNLQKKAREAAEIAPQILELPSAIDEMIRGLRQLQSP